MPDRPNIKRRIVVHFPGYEPLDAEQHRQRYERAGELSAGAFGFHIQVSAMTGQTPAPHFQAKAGGEGWDTKTVVHILSHDVFIRQLAADPFPVRLLRGYRAAAITILEGGLYRYFKVSWRFALFFLFSFVLMTAGIAAAWQVSELPMRLGLGAYHLLWSIPLAALLFFKLFLPWTGRFHTLHLFDDWHFAVRLARLDDPAINAMIDRYTEALEAILAEPADEYVITGHSMGGTVAAHVLGALIGRNPEGLRGKRITLGTLGGSGFQTSLLGSAKVLRARIRNILGCHDVRWIDFQCLTDIANFYNSRVARDNGHGDLPEPAIVTIRVRNMLTAERYKRIKRDFLRVHRQFVLGSDKPTHFDYALLTAGPFEAAAFSRFAPNQSPLEPGVAVTNPGA